MTDADELDALNARLAALEGDDDAVLGEAAGQPMPGGRRDRDGIATSSAVEYAPEFARTTQNEYDYIDPDMPGAAPGRQSGAMAHELRGIPGVVSQRPDGLEQVDPGRLAMSTAPVVGAHERELADLRAQIDALSEGDDETVLRRATGGR
jgi:hypothetical protein